MLVRPDPPPALKSNIVLAESAQRPPNTGKVVDIGPEVPVLKRGQRIVYAGRVGIEVDVDRTTYLLLPFSACLAVIP